MSIEELAEALRDTLKDGGYNAEFRQVSDAITIAKAARKEIFELAQALAKQADGSNVAEKTTDYAVAIIIGLVS